MSFFTSELSVFGSKPVELYEFVAGQTRWHFTSGRNRVEYATYIYEPRAIRRSKIEQTKEFARSSITIEAPADFPVSTRCVATPLNDLLQLTIYRMNGGEFAVYWQGRVVSTSFRDGRSTLKCDNAYTGIQSQGRRATGSVQCRHTLYRPGCNVNDQAFRESGTLTAKNGISLESSVFGSKPDGWFSGGKFVTVIDGSEVGRKIIEHVGTNIKIFQEIPEMAANAAFDAFPGCSHDLAGCQKFDNVLNYGGFPWKPVKNPFTGDSVF